MLHGQQAEVQMRRAQMQARSHALRQRLGQEAQGLRRPLALADQARSGFRWLVSNPQWLVALVAIPVLLRPRRAFAWGLKLWWGWRMWRQLRQLLPPQSPWNPPAR